MSIHQPCVFCAIIQGHLPATIIHQTDEIIIIQDRAPKAPIHWLVLPKRHIENISALAPDDLHIIGQLMWESKQAAQAYGHTNEFRLLTNNGASVGQSVFHLHFHLLAGTRLNDF
jgi:histidine triad (HIT) family protein